LLPRSLRSGVQTAPARKSEKTGFRGWPQNYNHYTPTDGGGAGKSSRPAPSWTTGPALAESGAVGRTRRPRRLVWSGLAAEADRGGGRGGVVPVGRDRPP